MSAFRILLFREVSLALFQIKMKRKIKLSSLSKQVQASIRKELAQQNGLSEVASRFVAELEKSMKKEKMTESLKRNIVNSILCVSINKVQNYFNLSRN